LQKKIINEFETLGFCRAQTLQSVTANDVILFISIFVNLITILKLFNLQMLCMIILALLAESSKQWTNFGSG
jgi:hypothetical protein